MIEYYFSPIFEPYDDYLDEIDHIMASGTGLNIELARDCFETPWGFRLQGGRDFNTPLVVQRVFAGSPAEGQLQRGDVITAINGRDATLMLHKEAQDLISTGGGTINLTIRRVGYVPSRSDAVGPQGPGFKPVANPSGSYTFPSAQMVQRRPLPHDEAKPPGADTYMLQRVNETLHTLSTTPRRIYPQMSYPAAFRNYNVGLPSPPKTVRSNPWSPPANRGNTTDLGWTPSVTTRSTAPVEAPINKPKPVPVNYRPPRWEDYDDAVDSSQPPWKDSLRNTGNLDYDFHKAQHRMKPRSRISWNPGPGHIPWGSQTMPIQRRRNQHTNFQQNQYKPSRASWGQPSTAAQTAFPSQTIGSGPQIAHLQYNDPIGLYSQQNVQEALQGQLSGAPVEYGTIRGPRQRQMIAEASRRSRPARPWAVQKPQAQTDVNSPMNLSAMQNSYSNRPADKRLSYMEPPTHFESAPQQSRSFKALQDMMSASYATNSTEF